MRRRRATNSGLARDDARLRPAEQLVAAEGNQVRAGRQAVGDQRLVDAEGAQVDDAAAAEVLVDRDAALAPQRHQFRSSGRAVNPVMRKLLGWTRSSRRVRSLMAAR